MSRELTESKAGVRSWCAPVLALALVSQPLAALEEIGVDGGHEAGASRAQQAHFRSQMDAYVEAVEVEFRCRLQAELERAVRRDARLATLAARRRG